MAPGSCGWERDLVVRMRSKPVISPSSAQSGLKISWEWADGGCATVSITQMETAGPCQRRAAPAPPPCTSTGYWDAVLCLGSRCSRGVPGTVLGAEHPGQVQHQGWGCPSQGTQAAPQGSSVLGAQERGTGGFAARCHKPLTMMKQGAAQTPRDKSKAHPGSQTSSIVGASTAGQGTGGQASEQSSSKAGSAHGKSWRSKSMAQFAAHPGRGLALRPAKRRQRAKLSAPPLPSLHILNPQGPRASVAADAKPQAIVHPIKPTEWEKEQRRCWKSQEGHVRSCRNGLQGKSTSPAPSRDFGSDTDSRPAGRAHALPWRC